MTCYNPQYAKISIGSRILKEDWLNYLKMKLDRPKSTIGHILNFNHGIRPTDEQIKSGEFIALPCRKCIGCILDHAATWSCRSYMESKSWQNNCFVTLTYDNEHLPKNRSLVKKDYQNFLKTLRKNEKGFEEWERLNKKTGELIKERPIRYFIAGEYGPKTKRPHYHIAIFNWKPDDLVFYTWNNSHEPLYTSKKLDKYWGKGYTITGNLTYESACYIARYTMKKWGRPINDQRQKIIDELTKKAIDEAEKLELYYCENTDTIEKYIHNKEVEEEELKLLNKYDNLTKSLQKNKLTPEFIEVSRNGGIGLKYWEKHKNKIKKEYSILTATKHGAKYKPIPEYFKNIWRKENPIEFLEKSEENMKQKRKEMNKIYEKTNLSIQKYNKLCLEQKLKQITQLKRTAN